MRTQGCLMVPEMGPQEILDAETGVKVLLFISTEPTFILSTAGTTVLGLNDATVHKIGFTLGKMSNKQINKKFQSL